jgi:hypothetical protein
MVDLRRAVYSKEFEYENVDGTKATIKLLPLNMSYLPFLFSLTKKFKPGQTGDEVMEALDADTLNGITDMCKSTIKRSVPEMSDDDINDFVVQHWSEMFPLIIELNLSKAKV